MGNVGMIDKVTSVHERGGYDLFMAPLEVYLQHEPRNGEDVL